MTEIVNVFVQLSWPFLDFCHEKEMLRLAWWSKEGEKNKNMQNRSGPNLYLKSRPAEPRLDQPNANV